MKTTGRIMLGGAALLVAFAIGGGAAWVATGKASSVDARGPAPWRTTAGVGEASGTPFLRAATARVGLWALPQSEVIYFNAERDGKGDLLDSRCTYELKGRDLPARWWSIGSYVDYHWVPNAKNRYSYTQSNILRDADGGYTIRVSPHPQQGNWLPLGQRAGRVTLLTRLYQPVAGLAEKPEQAPLPTVRKITCA